jgi:hypothetical protein
VTVSPELVSLLYRLDWARLSMSAELVVRRDRFVSQRLIDRVLSDMRRASGGVLPPLPLSEHVRLFAGAGAPSSGPRWIETRRRILLASGGRYRVEVIGDDRTTELIFCDGASCWVMHDGEADRYAAGPAMSPVEDLIRPSWLLSRFDLTEAGTAEVAGHIAYRLVATPRPPADKYQSRRYCLLDRVDLLVEADTGIVLRREEVFGGQPVEIAELRDFALDPPAAHEPALFRPAAGVPVEDCGGPAEFLADLEAQQDGFDSEWSAGAGGIGVSLAAGALRLAAWRTARPEPQRGAGIDEDATMPEEEAGRSAGADRREPISDELLNLIARVGLPPQTLNAEFITGLTAKRSGRDTTSSPSPVTSLKRISWPASSAPRRSGPGSGRCTEPLCCRSPCRAATESTTVSTTGPASRRSLRVTASDSGSCTTTGSWRVPRSRWNPSSSG